MIRRAAILAALAALLTPPALAAGPDGDLSAVERQASELRHALEDLAHRRATASAPAISQPARTLKPGLDAHAYALGPAGFTDIEVGRFPLAGTTITFGQAARAIGNLTGPVGVRAQGFYRADEPGEHKLFLRFVHPGNIISKPVLLVDVAAIPNLSTCAGEIRTDGHRVAAFASRPEGRLARLATERREQATGSMVVPAAGLVPITVEFGCRPQPLPPDRAADWGKEINAANDLAEIRLLVQAPSDREPRDLMPLLVSER